MNWILGALVGASIVATLALHGIEKRRLGTLPVMDDVALARRCPAGISVDRWVAARRDLGRMIQMPPERLDPAATLESLVRHMRPFDYPYAYLDFDTLVEQWERAFGRGSFSLELRVEEVLQALIRGSIA